MSSSEQEFSISCKYCPKLVKFDTSDSFVKHLRECHCTREGGSFVCHYGENDVCPSLPLDGVSDQDYQNHVVQYHVRSGFGRNSCQWLSISSQQNLSAVLTDPKKGKQSNFFTRTWGDSFKENVPLRKSKVLPTELDESLLISYKAELLKRLKATKPPKSSLYANDNLQQIPDIFFQENNFLDILRYITPLAAHKEKMQLLTTYLDQVEVRLASQISGRSQQFFAAIRSSDTISSDVNAMCKRIAQLRSKLHYVQKQSTIPVLKLLHLQRKKTRFQALLRFLNLTSTVTKSEPSLQLLLNTCDYVAALELIASTKSVLQTDLRGFRALQLYDSRMNEVLKTIDVNLNLDLEKSLCTHFQMLLHDIHPVRDFDTDFFVSLVAAFLTRDYNCFASKLKDESFQIIEMIIKQILINYMSALDSDMSLNRTLDLSDMSRYIKAEDWFIIIRLVTKSLTHLIEFLKYIEKLVLQVIESNRVEKSEAELKCFRMQLEDCIVEVCNRCQTRLSALLKAQFAKKQQSLGEVSKFSAQVNSLNNFIDDCVKSTNKKCNATLKTIMKTEMELRFQKFHSERKAQLLMLFKSENWKPNFKVPSSFQTLIDYLVLKQSNKESADSNYNEIFEDFRYDSNSSMTVEFLQIDCEQFIVPNSLLMFLKFVAEYVFRLHELPLIKVATLSTLLDLLRTYNSKVNHLILNGEAVNVAKLSQITIENVAVALRSLQLLTAIFQHLKTQKIFESNMSAQFDELLKQIDQNINKSYSKIVTIVNISFEVALENWEAKPPIPSNSFKTILLQLDQSKAAILPVLTNEQASKIFEQIHKNFLKILKEKMHKLNLIRNSGSGANAKKTQVWLELNTYLDKLKCLDVIPIEHVTITSNDFWT